MRRLVAISVSLGLLAACATAPGPSRDTPAAEINYLCDDFTAIAMHPGVDAIAVLSSGLELRLPQYPGAPFPHAPSKITQHAGVGLLARFHVQDIA